MERRIKLTKLKMEKRTMQPNDNKMITNIKIKINIEINIKPKSKSIIKSKIIIKIMIEMQM